MKEFLNFEIQSRTVGSEVQHILEHPTLKGTSVTFKTGVDLHYSHLPDLIKGVMKAYAKKFSEATRKPLTPSQKALYNHLLSFHKKEGRAPSYEELRIVLGAKSKGTPWQGMAKLLEKGWVWKDGDGFIFPIDIATPDIVD